MNLVAQLLKYFIDDAAGNASVAPAALLLPLEPRIVYDASVAALGGAAQHAHEVGVHGSAAAGAAASGDVFASASGQIGAARAPGQAGEHPAASAVPAQIGAARDTGPAPAASTEHQVVFIDPNVADYQSLIAGLPAGTAYVVLNQNSDGLEQIAQYLQQHPGIDAVHLVSHGSEAQVQVGGTLLDTADLSTYSAELAQIGAAMKPGGDFLIYGCDVAEGSDGQALVQQIAALSHLNVAASTSLVGAAALGGSWTLDYDVGAVRTPVIFSAASEQQYGYVFTQTIEDYTSNPSFDSGAVSSFSLDGITYTITTTGVVGPNVVTPDSTLQALPDETLTDNSLLFDTNGITSSGITKITITMTDGSAFNISSLDIDVFTSDTAVTFTTNNVLTTGPAIALPTSTHVSFGAGFSEITSLSINGSNMLVNLGHLVYNEVSPPVVTTSGGTTSYVGGATATAVDGGATVSDTSLGTLGTPTTGTVTIGSFSSGDLLSFTGSAATGNISKTFSNGVLTLTSADGSATATQWTNAFDAVTFSSTSTSYGNRIISFVVNDGVVDSVAATKTLTVVNPAPIITTDSGSASFTAGDNVTSMPVAIDSGLNLSDAGRGTEVSATVSLTNNFHSGEDVLALVPNSVTMGNIAGTYDAVHGVLTLTSSGGTATTAQWQAALDAVTYTDTAVTPNAATRTVSFAINDGTNSSTVATRNVTVADTDQTPIVTTTGGTTNYLGGASATAIDSGVTVSDLDNTAQASGTVSISSGFHSGDTLSFTNTSATLYGNISVSSYSAGVLTLTSASATATDAQWANAFDAVKFSAGTGVTPGNRTISFVVNDGTVNSAAATKSLGVTAPPIVTADSGSASFVAGDNTASTPVAIDPGLTVTDAGTSTVQSATVAITGNFHSGEDVLAFSNTSGTSFGNIARSYSAGVLTLTSAGNTATLAQWQAALDAVTYTDTAVTPNNATRTLSFSITDANSNVSNTATRNVTVTDTDQTPIVTTTGGTTSYVGGTAAIAIDGGVTVSDLDNTTQASGTVSISGGFHGGDTLSFTNASAASFGNITASYNAGSGVLTLSSSGAIATDAQWANALDAVTFSAATGVTPGNRTISFVVNDGLVNSAAATKTLGVTAPPIVTADSGSASFVAGDNTASTPVAIDSGLTVTDASTSTMQSATVAITGNFHNGEDVLAFTNNGLTMGNITGSYNATSGVLMLTSAGNSATLAQWQAALDAVTYTDTAVTPNNATRTLSFSITDANSNVSNTATRNVTVADTDQTPIVTTTGGTTSYVGGTAAIAIDGGVTVSDLDNTTQVSGTVSISGGFHGGDTLSFTNTSAASFGNITASYNAGSGVLTLSSSGAIATDAQWANALDAVNFSSSSTSYGNRTVGFVVNDGTENSVAATKTVAVTNPDPVITTDSGSAAFTAGDNTASTPVAIDSGLTVTDPVSATLASATVAITGNFHSGEDVLSLTNNGSTMGNITASYNATTGVLTLTSASATATTAQWQAALDAITYTDTAITPNTATRTLSFIVNDGTNSSTAATRTVTVADTDQTPIVTTTGGTASYVGGTTAIAVDGGATVSDIDNPTQALGTVSISSGFHSGDVLGFTNTSFASFGNITASYNAGSGVLTLSSSGAIATDAQWANALDAVTFSSSSTSYGNRTVGFVVNDGTENSVAATKTVAVTNPDPVITTDSGSVAFTAGNNVVSTPVIIDSGLTMTDPGSATLASATVAISGNFHSGEDLLSFTNNGSTMGNITASYNATTGVLTLTSASATATTAQWQTALDAVTYTDTAITPNTATRTLSFSVNDGTNSSTAASRTVTVADTDQTPLVTTTGGTTSYIGGTTAVAVDGGATVSDLDNPTQASGTVSISSGFHGGDVLGFTNTSATLFGNIAAAYDATTGVLTLNSSGASATDAQWANAFDAVTFVAGTNVVPGNRTISLVVSDGTVDSAAASKTVAVTAPPIVATDPGSVSFTAGNNVTSTPIAIDPGLTVTDASSATLASATVAITGNFQSGEDVLALLANPATMGNITGTYDAVHGVLTLTSSSGSPTTAQWQAALDAVTYTDTAVTPNTEIRTLSFSVSDGTNSSTAGTRTVTVADTDQTPVISGGGGSVSFISTGATPALAINPGLSLTDRAGTVPTSATVAITGGFESGVDVLDFSGSGATGNIAASYNSSTGVLTLTSADGTATLAQWQAALNAITYTENAGNLTSGTRTLNFSVSDGRTSSAPVTVSVVVDVQNALPQQSSPASTQSTQLISSTTESGEVGDDVSNPMIVLATFDQSASIDSMPVTHTTTFSSDSGHDGSGNALGTTSVTGEPPPPLPFTPSSAPFSLPAIERLSIAPDQPFSMVVSNATPGDGSSTSEVVVRQVDGRALPSWMHFDAAAGTLSGTAPADGPRVLRLVVAVRDSAGHLTRREVVIDLGTRHAPHPTGHAPAHRPAPQAALPAAKPSLTAQFARLRRELHLA